MRIRGNRKRRHDYRCWLLRRARRNLARRRRAENPLAGIEVNGHLRDSIRVIRNRVELVLPETIDLEENFEKVASFLTVLRRLRGRRLRRLGFERIRFISPSAALVLASEVDKWMQITKRRITAQVKTWHPDITRLLFEMGYFELLGLNDPEILASKKNTSFLKFVRGDKSEQDPGKVAQGLRKRIEELVGEPIAKSELFDGLSEAITNTGQHAYQVEDLKKNKQWWVSASYDKEQRQLHVTFYDQGRGIPVTLPHTHGEDLRHWIDKHLGTNLLTHSYAIKAAMQVGRTSTERDERGQGSTNLEEFAKRYRGGRLTIYSLKGRCNMTRDDDGELRYDHSSMKDSKQLLQGTLIEWSVTI